MNYRVVSKDGVHLGLMNKFQLDVIGTWHVVGNGYAMIMRDASEIHISEFRYK